MDVNQLQDRLSQVETWWGVLLQAQGASAERRAAACEKLMERYGPLIRRYLLAAVKDAEAADDLFQEFALRFVSGRFQNVDPTRGRFRDYLKTCLFHLVADFRGRRARERSLPLPAGAGEPAADLLPEDDEECRLWREDLISRALSALEREEQRETRKQFLYTALRCRIDHPKLNSEQLAECLVPRVGRAVTAGWVRKRLMAARQRFAQQLIDEVAQALQCPTVAQVEEELAELGLRKYCAVVLDRLRR